ncbi:MAG: DUF1624 domain-containing protein [Ignavibacteriaceae bacterium]|nr:DUF1624 domain-containing protein [Ignavibacteriaceae bacterium]
MTHVEKKHRIIFIDLMRAFAVLQMVQGHTVDALLADSFRDTSYPVYAVWHFMRGMTAPIFMFTSGIVFTYLFRLVNRPFFSNPRVFKGFKRFLLLVFLGYLLRYPTPFIIDFSIVTPEGWQIFKTVDVLHLIGFSLLIILILSFISEVTKLGDYFTFIFSGFLIFGLHLYFEKINWSDFLPDFISGYFYTGNGSLFPIFPWAGFVILGAVLGSYLAKNPLAFRSAKFSQMLLIFGLGFLVIALLVFLYQTFIGVNDLFYTETVSVILLRLGFVLCLNALVSYISLNVETIPKLFILVGRNTLLIYIVHLVIIFGSAWNPGLSLFFAKSFSVWPTVFAAVFMLFLMAIMVLLLDRYKIKSKQLVT